MLVDKSFSNIFGSNYNKIAIRNLKVDEIDYFVKLEFKSFQEEMIENIW